MFRVGCCASHVHLDYLQIKSHDLRAGRPRSFVASQSRNAVIDDPARASSDGEHRGPVFDESTRPEGRATSKVLAVDLAQAADCREGAYFPTSELSRPKVTPAVPVLVDPETGQNRIFSPLPYRATQPIV
jgi:hypothetical protein